MSHESIKDLVNTRLKDKEADSFGINKRRVGERGDIHGSELTEEQKKYLMEHDVISKQKAEPDVEECDFSFFPPLWNQRISFISKIALQHNVTSIIDYGCGSGKFISFMRTCKDVELEFFGVDIDRASLLEAKEYCAPYSGDFLHRREKPMNIHLFYGSILEPESFLRNKDCLVCIEVMEHILRPQADELAHIVLGYLRPRVAIFSTPNSDFNIVFTKLQSGKFRHWDHKFEMSRKEFQIWANTFANKYNYSVEFTGVGDPPSTHNVGHCTQIAIFRLNNNLEPMYNPQIQQLQHVCDISFPIQEQYTLEEQKKSLENSVDYYYRFHCQQNDEYNVEYDIWVPISTILQYSDNELEKAKTNHQFLIEVLTNSKLFELSEDLQNIRGTPYYVQLNDPDAQEEEDDEDDMYNTIYTDEEIPDSKMEDNQWSTEW